MDKATVIELAREAGWSGIYTQWREPDGSPDWTPVKESLTVPVTMEQIERFAALVAAHEREAIAQSLDKQADLAGDPMDREWAQEMAAAVRGRGQT